MNTLRFTEATDNLFKVILDLNSVYEQEAWASRHTRLLSVYCHATLSWRSVGLEWEAPRRLLKHVLGVSAIMFLERETCPLPWTDQSENERTKKTSTQADLTASWLLCGELPCPTKSCPLWWTEAWKTVVLNLWIMTPTIEKHRYLY